MKKQIITTLLTTSMVLGLVACGEQAQEPEPVNETPAVEETQQEVSEEPQSTELTDDERAEVFSNYLDSQTKLADTTFSMDAKCTTDGIAAKIDGTSGILYWQYPLKTKNLITTEYDCESNCLTFKSLNVNTNKEIEVVDEVKLEDFIGFNDSLDVLFSAIAPGQDRDAIMVESRGMAYTYADGVDYQITLIEIGEDGLLETIYDDGLAGSGDEDITSELRKGFNEVMGHEYSQDEFEDMFYNGNMFIDQEGKPVHAKIEFKSDSAKLADSGDWDGASAIASKIYENMGTEGENIHWGEGKITADSYK